MMCEVCLGLGTGVVLRRAFTGESPGRLVPRPCPECNGSGIAHCCEGERPGNVATCRHPMFDEGFAAEYRRQARLLAAAYDDDEDVNWWLDQAEETEPPP